MKPKIQPCPTRATGTFKRTGEAHAPTSIDLVGALGFLGGAPRAQFLKRDGAHTALVDVAQAALLSEVGGTARAIPTMAVSSLVEMSGRLNFAPT